MATTRVSLARGDDSRDNQQSTSLALSQQQQQEAQMSARSQQIRKATPASKHLILTQ